MHWHYPPVFETPRFTVEIKPYNLGVYKTISTCVNTSAHFCDLSGEIEDLFSSHWFRVKAVLESEQSEYVETSEFILRKHGEIGPPKLHLSRHSDRIIVDIYHPPFPSVELYPWIRKVYSELTYAVTFRDSKNQSKEEFLADDCNMHECNLNIPIPSEGSIYCVSARGSLYNDLIFGVQSEESCIHVPNKQTLSTQNTIIVVGIILSFGLILITCCGFKKLRKKNIKLPKSLVSVIRNLNTDNFLEPKLETNYNSVVSLMPDEAASPVNDEVNPLKVEQKEGIVNPENSSEGASCILLPEVPSNTGEVSVQESTEEVSSDDEQSHKVKDNYFISGNNQTELCSNSSDPEVSTTEVQQTVNQSSCLKFSGYDKPHVPLDMLIDVGEEQPVIAYRPTD
ncbi:interferon gamma receptor 1 isoform X1 [Dromaius novaehollandiae]|uniref:Interferon gamma receptor 1 n=4 Tax=Dromaius novaehollandiae TaxID=8790 RepID=A0A8C4JPP3_DRONO|nr:interferon gamma receptor 1 [Dromaius novaehollandiae]